MAGSYSITNGDLRFSAQRLIDLTDDTGTAVDQAKVDAAIAAAEDEFHLYAGAYYATPVKTADNQVPPGIKQKLADAARWFLMQNRPEFLRSNDDEGEHWEVRRKEHLTWLKSIADADPKERLPIPGAVVAETTTARGGTASLVSDDPFFTSTTGYF